jgi:hypothetical protein
MRVINAGAWRAVAVVQPNEVWFSTRGNVKQVKRFISEFLNVFLPKWGISQAGEAGRSNSLWRANFQDKDQQDFLDRLGTLQLPARLLPGSGVSKSRDFQSTRSG